MPKSDNPKSNAERQAEYQATLRALTPVERYTRAAKADGVNVSRIAYTPDEQILADSIRSHSSQVKDLAETLNARLASRLADPAEKGDPASIGAMEILSGHTRVQIKTY